jgi:hypothetical protein
MGFTRVIESTRQRSRAHHGRAILSSEPTAAAVVISTGMQHAVTDAGAIPAPPAPGAGDLIDEALAGLPAPPRARVRVLGALLTAVSVASVALAWQLRDDVRYAFAPAEVVELGDGRTADLAGLHANRVVHLHASPQMGGAVRYSRPFYPGEYIVFPVAGRVGEPLYLQMDAGDGSPGEFTGRLVPFAGAGGRYARVGRFLRDDLGAPVNGSTWLVVSGAMPHGSWWAPVLASFLLALALSDLVLLARLVRPIE